MLPEILENFLSQAPISLQATSPNGVSLRQIQNFFEEHIAPKVSNKIYGELSHAALMLAFDYIWEAHEIIQVHSQMEASWWHAFMHRMEGDFGNSDYWYKRVSAPQDFINFKNMLDSLEMSPRLSSLKESRSWQPIEFNKLLSRYKSSLSGELHQVHKLEFMYVFKITYDKSVK